MVLCAKKKLQTTVVFAPTTIISSAINDNVLVVSGKRMGIH